MSNQDISAVFRFHGDLPLLLRGRWKGRQTISYPISRRASVKDIIESFGLPHTEVGAIQLDGTEVDFNHIVEMESSFDIQPVQGPYPWKEPATLRPIPFRDPLFIADVNVGRLARYLRATGIDTLYDPAWNDAHIAEIIRHEQRILLTRDMRLLMRRHVIYGRYIRTTDPVEQLREVIDFFGLAQHLAPFSRCLGCNATLKQVQKEEVLDRLEPLTRKYYSSFSRCPRCDKIFWPGSHIDRMRELFAVAGRKSEKK